MRLQVRRQLSLAIYVISQFSIFRIIIIMGTDYDDWGIPKRPRYEPIQHDKTPLGMAKAYGSYAVRRYRILIYTILFAICLLVYITREGSTAVKEAKVDWKEFAYVQYADIHPLEKFLTDLGRQVCHG